MPDLVIVLTTVPAGGHDAIARALVEERLAACVNALPPMTSVYRWKGAVEQETEQQLVIKTLREHVPAVFERLRRLHPYELPEFVVLSAADASDAYLTWVRESTGRP
jgi:periplasmic divalent cation tolerance protein